MTTFSASQAAAALQFDGYLARDLEAYDQRFEQLDQAYKQLEAEKARLRIQKKKALLKSQVRERDALNACFSRVQPHPFTIDEHTFCYHSVERHSKRSVREWLR